MFACVGTVIASLVGAVTWATSFETKVMAAKQYEEQNIRINAAEKVATEAALEVHGLRSDVEDVRATVNRVDDKIDKVLLRLSVRR
jgi:peptidoglycan hydrolase CwlO-like protein